MPVCSHMSVELHFVQPAVPTASSARVRAPPPITLDIGDILWSTVDAATGLTKTPKWDVDVAVIKYDASI